MALGRWVKMWARGALWTMAGVIDGLRRMDVRGVAQVRTDRQRDCTIGYKIVQAEVHIGGCCS